MLSVTNYKEETSQPADTGDKEIDALLEPARVLKQKEVSFDINNASSAFVSAIRHCIISQLPVYALNFKPQDYHIGNEKHQDIDFVRQNIRQIPIPQTDDVKDIEFSLRAENTNPFMREVKSGEMVQRKGKKGIYFAPNITIALLNPGGKMYIDNIYATEGVGYYKIDHGGLKLGYQAMHYPIGIKMWNQFDRDGEIISVSDPRNHHFYFRTEGQEEPKKTIKRACNALLERLANLRNIIHTMRKFKDYYVLEVSNETDAIGNLICSVSYDLFEENEGWKYTMDDINEVLKIEMRGEDAEKMLNDIIYNCEQQFQKFRSFF